MNIFITENLNKFSGIRECPAVELCPSKLQVDNIYFSVPYNNIPKLDLVFFFEPWDDGFSDSAIIDDTANHPDTALIEEAPYIFIVDTADELCLYHIFEYSIWLLRFYVYSWFVSSFF